MGGGVGARRNLLVFFSSFPNGRCMLEYTSSVPQDSPAAKRLWQGVNPSTSQFPRVHLSPDPQTGDGGYTAMLCTGQRPVQFLSRPGPPSCLLKSVQTNKTKQNLGISPCLKCSIIEKRNSARHGGVHTCRRQRQEDQGVKARLGYIMRPCLSEKGKKEKP